MDPVAISAMFEGFATGLIKGLAIPAGRVIIAYPPATQPAK